MGLTSVFFLVLSGPSSIAFAPTDDELVSSRLSSDVAICLQGESCGQAVLAATSSSAAGGSRSSEQIYTSGCAACHDAGVAGAPMLANQSQWEQRLAKGTDMLINNAWSGIGGMPAKGLCGDCTKEEIGLAVEYMLDTL